MSARPAPAHGGERVARALAAHGIGHLFTLCGGHISPILVAAKAMGIAIHDTRHEATAVFAADAHARLTGLPGVAAVTAGPGLTNTLTALKNAQLAQSPVVLLGGAAPTALQGRGALQDIDQKPLVAPHVKLVKQVRRVADLGPAVEEALIASRSGVPGPTFVECPVDLLYDETLIRGWYADAAGKGTGVADRLLRWYLGRHANRMFAGSAEAYDPVGRAPAPPVAPAGAVARAAEALAGAKQPLLVLGSQCVVDSPTAEATAAAVAAMGIPVYLSGMARGLLGADHPLLRRHERRKALRESDCVLLAGVPCDFRLDYGKHVRRSATLIAANRSRRDARLNRKPTIEAIGDAGRFVRDVAGAVGGRARRDEWLAALAARDAAREAAIDTQATHRGEHVNPVAFFREMDRAASADALFVADADGTNERPVVAARGMHMHWPSWSPDGRSLYFIQTPQTSNAEPVEIHRVSADGGPVETVVATARRAIFPIPTNDGRGLLYAANPFTAELGLWWKPLRADATPRQVTSGVGEYQDLAVSAGTGDAVASIVELRQSIVAIDTDPHAGGASREITDGSSGDLDPVLSPQNDRLVFSSIRSGNRQLWSAEPDGQRPRRLTTGDSLDEQATISPDGRRTAFVSDRGGRRGLWVMNADGGVPRLLVHALVVDVPSWSPDGQELVYTTPIADAPGLWVVEVETSTVRRLATPGPARAPVWHPSADLIAYIEARRPEAGQPNSSRVAFVNRRGEPQHPGLTESPNLSNGFLAWSPDARSLAALIEPGSTPSAVWILDPSGVAPPRSVGAFPIGVRLRGATWTPDGRTLLVGRSQQSSDIVFFQR